MRRAGSGFEQFQSSGDLANTAGLGSDFFEESPYQEAESAALCISRPSEAFDVLEIVRNLTPTSAAPVLASLLVMS